MSNPTANPRPQGFKWAHERTANLREPVDALKEKGWQYADVPTASNFNWLFNQIQKELERLDQGLNQLNEAVITEFKTIKEKLSSVQIIAKDALEKSIKNKTTLDWSIGVSRQICRQLREMENEIRNYHRNFPSQPWPLDDN